jgi:hypothetical protein
MRTTALCSPLTLLRISAVCLPFLATLATANASPIDVTIPSGTTGTMNYVIFFADVTIGGNTTGQWFETPMLVDTGTLPQITVTDTSARQVTLSNVGFLLSPTLIPLDNLNYMDYPPPGSAGTQFTPMSGYDTTLSSGSSITQGNSEAGSPVTLETTPLPATWTLLIRP